MSNDDYSANGGGHWNTLQLSFIASCLLPMVCFSKFLMDSYLGSGWKILCSLLYLLLFAGPFCYVQFRVGSMEQSGMLQIFKQYCPIANVAGFAAIFTNLIKLIMGSCFVTYTMVYVFFTYYHCDGRHCVGSLYIWGSCHDSWSEGDCREGYEKVYTGPTAEEKFMTNYVLDRSDAILPLYGFPSWFLTNACVVVTYLIAWLCIFILTISGRRIFGIILYLLAPMTTVLLLGTVITIGANYANAASQLRLYVNRFYATFATIVPVDQYARDQFEVQPLVWGWLSTFVHLSQGLGLWTGIFPLLGKWSGSTGRQTYIGWIPLLISWRLLIELPVLIFLFSIASSYDPDYARCHLSTGWQAPFLIPPHVFSKFSGHRLLAGCYFVALLLCLFLSETLLLMTSVQNFTEFVTSASGVTSRRRRCIFRSSLTITAVFLFMIGLPMITRAGFYWIRLVDWYVDRMLLIVAPLQATGYLIAYIRSRERWVRRPTVRLGVIVFMSVLIFVSTVVYFWYALAFPQPSPDTNCPIHNRAPENDPIYNEFRMLGYIIATGPLFAGLLFTLIAVRTESVRSKKSFCRTLISGDHYGSHRPIYYEPDFPMMLRRYGGLDRKIFRNSDAVD